MKHLLKIALVLTTTVAAAFGQDGQWVEGFDKIEFRYDGPNTVDYRGTARGYGSAQWWAPGQMTNNMVSWRTAAVPARKPTTFAFIASTGVLPSEVSRGPAAKLFINDKYALTFTLGMNRDYTWKEGPYTLKYYSKRVEFPYNQRHRIFTRNGNSGLFHFSVPAEAVEANQPALLKVQIMDSKSWDHTFFMIKERNDALKQSMENLEQEVEVLRQDMAFANEQIQVLATQVYSDLLGRNKFEHHVVYTEGYRHLHPADIIRLKSGDILLCTRVGSEHLSRDGDVIMLRSKDGGLTWGDKQVIGGIKDLDEREGCGVQLADGTIVVGIYFNDLYEPNGRYNPQLKREPGKNYLGAYFISSKDDGHTWSQPMYVNTKGMPFSGALEGPTDAPIAMPDGSVIMGVIGYGLHGDKKNVGSVLLRSEDQCKTWKYVSTIASDPNGEAGGFVEPGLVRAKSGRIIAGLRNHGLDNAIYTTYSDDAGQTWAPVQKTDMHGHPVDLIQLADGRILATYGIRPEHDLPGGIRACFSTDNGQTWDIRSEIQIRNDFFNMDVGYPESMEMPDGRILTVYYYNLFARYFIGETYWKP